MTEERGEPERDGKRKNLLHEASNVCCLKIKKYIA